MTDELATGSDVEAVVSLKSRYDSHRRSLRIIIISSRPRGRRPCRTRSARGSASRTAAAAVGAAAAVVNTSPRQRRPADLAAQNSNLAPFQLPSCRRRNRPPPQRCCSGGSRTWRPRPWRQLYINRSSRKIDSQEEKRSLESHVLLKIVSEN